MCGICGILGSAPDNELAQMVRRMTAALTHRGPDGEGIHVEPEVALGHRRLAIIDLSSAGEQPMSNETGDVWLTYNGEIYNHPVLRKELESHGHVFRSRTDSEVVIHAYEEWGTESVRRLVGMFAFALWDRPQRRLWLVRDRLGIKPLFYADLPDHLIFGSEVRSLLQCPGVPRKVDIEALALYLGLNWTPAPRTLLSAVHQVMPGEFLLVNEDGRIERRQYWELMPSEAPARSTSEWAEAFDELMGETVNSHLISDVPFGAFLSGGLDSSSISYWMSRGLDTKLKTFTIAFGEYSYDESNYARMVSERLGVEAHHETVLPDAVEVLPQLVRYAGEPTADSSMLAMYYLARLARREVSMVMSGDGADEILAGYETYPATLMVPWYQRIPRSLRSHVISSLVRQLPVSTAKVGWEQKIKRFVRGAEMPPEDAHATWRLICDQSQRRELLAPLWNDPRARTDVVDLYRVQFQRCPMKDPLDRLLWIDTRLYLPNDMLVKVDRMTMAHGLEARVPFLDHRVVEFCAALPKELKLRGFNEGKSLLRRLMRGKLPDKVLQRRKAGFNIPVGPWLRGPLCEFARDLLSPQAVAATGLLNAAAVNSLLDSHEQCLSDASHQIWGLMTLMLWLREIGKEAAA